MHEHQFLKHYWQVADNVINCITVKEYSKENHLHPSHVRKLLKHGRIKGIKCNGKWYILPNQKK